MLVSSTITVFIVLQHNYNKLLSLVSGVLSDEAVWRVALSQVSGGPGEEHPREEEEDTARHYR